MARCKECMHYDVCTKECRMVQLHAHKWDNYNQLDYIEVICNNYLSAADVVSKRDTYYIEEGKPPVLIETSENRRSKIAREIFEEIEKAHDECIGVDITTRIGYFQQTKFEHKLAELKKKYTEGEE